jgi:hypothetical protein
MVDHSVVKVLTAQMSVPSRGLDFKCSIFNGKDGDIKCTTAEVINKDISFSITLKNLKIGYSNMEFITY